MCGEKCHRLRTWKNKMWLEANGRKQLTEETEDCFNSNSHWVVESATKRCGQEGTAARSQRWFRWSSNGANAGKSYRSWRSVIPQCSLSAPLSWFIPKQSIKSMCLVRRSKLKLLIKLMQDGEYPNQFQDQYFYSFTSITRLERWAK